MSNPLSTGQTYHPDLIRYLNMEPELQHPLILRFLEGRMSPEEQSTFQSRLSREPDLALEVAVHEALLQHRNERLRQKWRAERSRPPQNGYAPKALIAAAFVVLTAIIAYFVLTPSKDVYACGSKKYQRLEQSGLLSSEVSNEDAQHWQTATAAYQQKHFNEALQQATLLFAAPDYRDKARLLAGATEQENEHPEAAIVHYDQIRPEATLYYGRGQLNKALALRCMDKKEAARIILENIQKDNRYAPALQRQAEALLKEMQ